LRLRGFVQRLVNGLGKISVKSSGLIEGRDRDWSGYGGRLEEKEGSGDIGFGHEMFWSGVWARKRQHRSVVRLSGHLRGVDEAHIAAGAKRHGGSNRFTWRWWLEVTGEGAEAWDRAREAPRCLPSKALARKGTGAMN